MSEKGIGSKFLGLFVETEGAASDAAEAPPTTRAQSPADLVADLARSSGGPARISSQAVSHPAPPSPLEHKLQAAAAAAPTHSGPLDFDGIFRSAGMDPGELDRVKKAEDLLKSLPEATPVAVKKQIVEASLKAFGFEIDKILLAANNQKRALDAYVKVNETGTAKGIEDAQKQIEAFTAKIAALRADIEKRTQTLSSVSESAQGRKADVQKVIDFFQTPPAA
jgi:hypothetical protein